MYWKKQLVNPAEVCDMNYSVVLTEVSYRIPASAQFS